MYIIINRQTNTREHQCNSKKPSPSTPKPNALVVRSLTSANSSTNNLHLQGECLRLAAIADDRTAVPGNAAKRRQLSFRNGDTRKIQEFFLQKEEDKRAKHESYELKWAGECVADGYRKQMTQEFRKIQT
eukprot:scaffold197677_cov50-Cyclotella_meneghiniana.AAC.4